VPRDIACCGVQHFFANFSEHLTTPSVLCNEHMTWSFCTCCCCGSRAGQPTVVLPRLSLWATLRQHIVLLLLFVHLWPLANVHILAAHCVRTSSNSWQQKVINNIRGIWNLCITPDQVAEWQLADWSIGSHNPDTCIAASAVAEDCLTPQEVSQIGYTRLFGVPVPLSATLCEAAARSATLSVCCSYQKGRQDVERQWGRPFISTGPRAVSMR